MFQYDSFRDSSDDQLEMTLDNSRGDTTICFQIGNYAVNGHRIEASCDFDIATATKLHERLGAMLERVAKQRRVNEQVARQQAQGDE